VTTTCLDTHYCSLGNRGDGPCWLPLYLYSNTIDIKLRPECLPLASVSRHKGEEDNNNMTTRCCCCGQTAVQRSRLDHYLSSFSPLEDKIKHEPIIQCTNPKCIIQCTNPKCNGVQYFSCAMLFMDRVSEKVPRQVANIHPWVVALRHYHENQDDCVHLPDVIEVPCCISCSLSITIPEGMKPSLVPFTN